MSGSVAESGSSPIGSRITAERRSLLALACTILAGGPMLVSADRAVAAPAAEIDRKAVLALESLHAHNAVAKSLAETAKGRRPWRWCRRPRAEPLA